jgi:hypothetical protein
MYTDNERKYFDGYYLDYDDYLNTWCMVIQGPWNERFFREIKEKNIQALRLSASMGFIDEDISFISDLKDLVSVEIYNWSVTNLTPLYSLTGLKKLGIECNYKGGFDFSKLQNLEYYFGKWRPKSESLFLQKSLRYLNLTNYPFDNLEPLKSLIRLNALKLASNKLSTLKGIGDLQSLSVLDLYRCSKLQTLDPISQATSLQTLEIDTCKHISAIDGLSALVNLENLVLNNCGSIESLKPLSQLKQLKKLLFIESTVVNDGDLSVVASLPKLEKVGFSQHKHYTHTADEIDAIINNR